MALLDALRQSISNHSTGQVDPTRVAQTVGGIAAAMEAYASDHSRALLTHIIVPWALGIARLAPAKWILPSTVSPSCAFGEVDTQLCGSFAVGGCHICGRPICLTHALIAGDATLVCWTCMRVAAQHATPWKPPAAGKAGGSDVDWAYELLGVEPDCTDEQVKKAYKKRISQFHPDRQQGADAQAHGEIVRMITRAYEVITAHRGI